MSLFLIAGSIASTLCSCAATDSSAVVGYIDEHPITMEEFNYFLSQQKSSVCQSYSQLYGITSFDSAFWNNEYGDSTPLDSARASAKEACLEAYATQMLAEKTTSAEFLSFSQLKENAENFNTARKESTSNGGIVYGPIEYSFCAPAFARISSISCPMVFPSDIMLAPFSRQFRAIKKRPFTSRHTDRDLLVKCNDCLSWSVH